MKKVICLTLVILGIISCFTACNFTTDVSDTTKENAESTPKVEEMISLIAERRLSDAKTLLHPLANEKADGAIEQMARYIDGRAVNSMELMKINSSSSTGSSGKMRQEQVEYQLTLTDGEIVYLSAVYRSDNAGNGFVSFQLVLGIV